MNEIVLSLWLVRLLQSFEAVCGEDPVTQHMTMLKFDQYPLNASTVEPRYFELG